MRRLVIAALLGAAVSALLLSAARTVAFRDLDFWAYDFLINHGAYAPPSRAIVVVDFDDETFRAIGQYPIPRQIFADAIGRIAASGPRVIGVDLFVSEARAPGEDAQFRDVLSRAG